jgi:peptidyl-Lys metalloendopeptidase
MRTITTSAAALALGLGLATACAKEQPMRLRCELNMAKTLAPAQPATLVFALTNTGRDALQILNWQTPFEGIRAPMFTVSRDGVELDYRGIMLKRAAPSAQDYFKLGPGERRQASIELAQGWDVTAPGKYTVEYAAQLFDVIAGEAIAPSVPGAFNPVELDCANLAFVRQR